MTTETLKLKLSLSENATKKQDLNLEKTKHENNQLRQHCNQLIEDMEQVAMSIISSMKAYQSESRVNLFELQTQLQNKEKQLEEANNLIIELKQKNEELKSQSGANQLLFELHLKAIHVNYVNILENVFEDLHKHINDELDNYEKDGTQLKQRYIEAFKTLGLQCTFHTKEN